MPSPPTNLTTLLRTLAATKIDFLLVGGLAAVIQGAPLTTAVLEETIRRRG